MDDLIKALREFIERYPRLERLQPAFAFACLYLAACALGYQYIRWEYHLTPSLWLYAGSYVFRGVTLTFFALALLLFSFAFIARMTRADAAADAAAVAAADADRDASKQDDAAKKPALTPAQKRQLARKRLATALRIGAGSIILLLLAFVLYALMPSRVGHIQIRFVGEPDFDRDAFVYMVFELNKIQSNWEFEVCFDPQLSEDRMPDPTVCDHEEAKLLCQVTAQVEGKPTIAITSRSLAPYKFWTCRGQVSVVSTAGSEEYAPVSKIEYLAYCLIVQGTAIHLNDKAEPVAGSQTSGGGLLQFSPPRDAFKAHILAAHLSPDDQQKLLNRFGIQYFATCSELMDLKWLRGGDVGATMARYFPAATQPSRPSLGR